MEPLLWGKENIVLIELPNCFGKREEEDACASVISEDMKVMH